MKTISLQTISYVIKVFNNMAVTNNKTPNQISDQMRKIKSKNTKIELLIRKLVYKMGYRYRLYVAELPGKPDIVFKTRKKVIFIHGCFWHQHENCVISKLPKSNQEYWLPKLKRNKERDLENQEKLKKLGWSFLNIWECQIKDITTVEKTIRSFLS